MTLEEPAPSPERVPYQFGDLGSPSLVRRHDAMLALGLVGGYAATFALPRRLDPWLAERLTRLFLRLRGRSVAATEAKIRSVMGPRADIVDLPAAVENYYAAKFEAAVGRVRGMRPRAWDPRIEVEGREHVDAALEAGRGAILWRMDMGDTLHLQRAAWQSGWSLVQLSSTNHGVGYSRLGFRLAPFYARPENAYLSERVRIPADWSLRYLPRLVRALEANQVVAILGEVIARQNIVLPFFEAERPIAPGAATIAHRTGAALIPAMTTREGRWRYRVSLGPPIEVDRTLSRRQASEQATAAFGQLLEQAVAAHPGDYNGWWALMNRRIEEEAEETGAPAEGLEGDY